MEEAQSSDLVDLEALVWVRVVCNIPDSTLIEIYHWCSLAPSHTSSSVS